MKKLIIPFTVLVSFVILSFTNDYSSKKYNKTSGDENWYLCSSCCKTKKQLQHHGKMGVKVLLELTTISFVVKREITITLVENVTLRYI